MFLNTNFFPLYFLSFPLFFLPLLHAPFLVNVAKLKKKYIVIMLLMISHSELWFLYFVLIFSFISFSIEILFSIFSQITSFFIQNTFTNNLIPSCSSSFDYVVFFFSACRFLEFIHIIFSILSILFIFFFLFTFCINWS